MASPANIALKDSGRHTIGEHDSGSVQDQDMAREPGQHPLMVLITQYALLKRMAREFTSKELACLGMTCKTAYINIFDDKHRAHAFSMTKCDGVGIRIRQAFHLNPDLSHGNILFNLNCRGEDPFAEIHACASCSAQTCDECRIHGTYQNLCCSYHGGEIMPTGFAGYTLLDPRPRHMFSPMISLPAQPNPHGFNFKFLVWAKTFNDTHNDEGLIYKPIHRQADDSRGLGPGLRSVKDILDRDLGLFTFAPKNMTTKPFKDVVEARKRFVCQECFEFAFSDYRPCSCTLRKQYLDKWTCLRCHIANYFKDHDEAKRLKLGWDPQKSCLTPGKCLCEERPGSIPVCSWCWGEVRDGVYESE